MVYGFDRKWIGSDVPGLVRSGFGCQLSERGMWFWDDGILDVGCGSGTLSCRGGLRLRDVVVLEGLGRGW